MTRSGDAASRKTYRERHRERRRLEFVATAMDIVTGQGLGALTMRAVTDALECSEGSIYQYFPTKDALTAAVQAEAMQTLGTSLLVSQATLAAIADERDIGDRVTSLVRAVGAARFWVEADTVYPQEVALTRSMFTSPVEVFSLEDGEPAARVGTQMLELGSTLCDTAVETGALAAGDGFERALVVLAATTGVLMAGDMERWDQRVADTRPAAHRLVTGQFLYWGAEAAELAEADAVIFELVADNRLVPRVPG